MSSKLLRAVVCTLMLSAPASFASGTEDCDDWARVPSPNRGDIANFLNGVSGVADDDVWAVGSYRVPEDDIRTDDHPLALHWDGEEWLDVPVPLPPSGNEEESQFFDVTAVASDDVWAVGNYVPPGAVNTIETLAMNWDGSDWELVPSPVAQVGNGSSFYAIDSKDGEIWAVGSSLGTAGLDNLAARWNGSGWDEHFPERIVLGNHRLTSVDIHSANEVWAAGNIGALGLPYVTRWDGSSWEVVEPRIDETLYLGLTSIITFGPDDVWVGASRTENFVFQYFVYLHFDGSSWTEHPVVHPYHVPAFGGDDPNDFYSAGYGTLARYDGTAWALVDSLAVDVWAISHIDVLPSGEVWGVGTTYDTGSPETLTAHFAPCEGTVDVAAPATSAAGGPLTVSQNQPNPMRAQTEIRYELAKPGHVQIDVYSILGRRVRSLESGHLDAGVHSVIWDGRDGSGMDVPNGIYVYRAVVGDVQLSRKLVLNR
jgi:hypothetical protein